MACEPRLDLSPFRDEGSVLVSWGCSRSSFSHHSGGQAGSQQEPFLLGGLRQGEPVPLRPEWAGTGDPPKYSVTGGSQSSLRTAGGWFQDPKDTQSMDAPVPYINGTLFSSVAQLCPALCDPIDCSTPGLPVHHQLPEFTQIHVHRVGDAVQSLHPLLSPSPPAFNLSQHQGLSVGI